MGLGRSQVAREASRGTSPSSPGCRPPRVRGTGAAADHEHLSVAEWFWSLLVGVRGQVVKNTPNELGMINSRDNMKSDNQRTFNLRQ